MESNDIFCNEILYYISRKNAVLINIAHVAQTIILVKIFKRNVRRNILIIQRNIQLSEVSVKCLQTLSGITHMSDLTGLGRILRPYMFSQRRRRGEHLTTLFQGTPRVLRDCWLPKHYNELLTRSFQMLSKVL